METKPFQISRPTETMVLLLCALALIPWLIIIPYIIIENIGPSTLRNEFFYWICVTYMSCQVGLVFGTLPIIAVVALRGKISRRIKRSGMILGITGILGHLISWAVLIVLASQK